MRKIIVILYLILTLGLSALFFYGNSKAIDYKLYTIKENISYVYEKNRTMTFNIYSEIKNPMIIYPEYNSYTLRLESLSHTLEEVTVEVAENSDINTIKITAKMPNLTASELYSKSCYLDIVNAEYSIMLNLGTFSMINSELYPQLELDSLSGSYSFIDDYFNLVGLNLKLTKNAEYINELRIGKYTVGILSKAKANLQYENEINIYDIIPAYNPYKLDSGYVYGVKSKTLFIPIGYSEKYLTRSGYIVILVDNKYYYFDNFPYMASDPSLSKYKNYLIEGEKYA